MVMGRAGRAALVVLLAALVVPRAARAEEEPKARAKRLVVSGSAKYEAGDFQGALQDFQQAFSAYHSAKILFNIGQSYRGMKEPALAAEAFGQFLEEASQDVNVDEKRIKEARTALKQLETEVDRVQVDITPKDAELELDGMRPVHPSFYMRKNGSQDLTKPHYLTATANGYQPTKRDFTLIEAEALAKNKQKLVLELKKVEITQAPTTSVLVPVAVPTKAPAPTTAPPVVIREKDKDDKKPDVPASGTQVASLNPSNGSSKPPDLSLIAPPPEKNHTPAFVAWGVGGALATGAAIVGFWALGQNNQLKCGHSGQPACTGTDFDTASSAHSKAQIADLLWLGTAVAGGTGAVLWFVAPGSPDGAGGEVGVTGHF
ncbi:MAG: hypothetical protein JST54_04630 [Deltaproteobacteria bacterium]|nr:hypothetical protein [Deltaproteobacteria bacterium]